jgi:DtxR family Mn-dependent transcriptional regulator
MKKQTPQAEEYLEALVRFKDKSEEPTVSKLAKELNVSKASVSQMLKKLADKKLVEFSRYSTPSLTQSGEEEGRKVLRKHLVIEKFLSLLGVKKSIVHEEACILEHAVSDEVERAIEKFAQNSKLGTQDFVRLTDLKKDECGKIIVIVGGRQACERLADMGLTIGASVCMSRPSSRIGPVEIKVRSSSLAIGRGLAEKIFVELRKQKEFSERRNLKNFSERVR